MTGPEASAAEFGRIMLDHVRDCQQCGGYAPTREHALLAIREAEERQSPPAAVVGERGPNEALIAILREHLRPHNRGPVDRGPVVAHMLWAMGLAADALVAADALRALPAQAHEALIADLIAKADAREVRVGAWFVNRDELREAADALRSAPTGAATKGQAHEMGCKAANPQGHPMGTECFPLDALLEITPSAGRSVPDEPALIERIALAIEAACVLKGAEAACAHCRPIARIVRSFAASGRSAVPEAQIHEFEPIPGLPGAYACKCGWGLTYVESGKPLLAVPAQRPGLEEQMRDSRDRAATEEDAMTVKGNDLLGIAASHVRATQGAYGLQDSRAIARAVLLVMHEEVKRRMDELDPIDDYDSGAFSALDTLADDLWRVTRSNDNPVAAPVVVAPGESQ